MFDNVAETTPLMLRVVSWGLLWVLLCLVGQDKQGVFIDHFVCGFKTVERDHPFFVC